MKPWKSLYLPQSLHEALEPSTDEKRRQRDIKKTLEAMDKQHFETIKDAVIIGTALEAENNKPLVEKALLFNPGKDKGSKQDNTRYIEKLVETHLKADGNQGKTYRDLWKIADKSKLGNIKESTFQNKVNLACDRLKIKRPARVNGRK